MKLNKYMQKICCFYASDWHLTVMLLPYINNKIKENVSIYMRCENNIEDDAIFVNIYQDFSQLVVGYLLVL